MRHELRRGRDFLVPIYSVVNHIFIYLEGKLERGRIEEERNTGSPQLSQRSLHVRRGSYKLCSRCRGFLEPILPHDNRPSLAIRFLVSSGRE